MMNDRRAEYDMKATGEKLKYYRKRMHLSVEQVRQYMRLSSVQAIYKWEKGDAFPTMDNFMALTELYRVSPLDVLVKKELIPVTAKEPIYDWVECHESNRLFRVYVI